MTSDPQLLLPSPRNVTRTGDRLDLKRSLGVVAKGATGEVARAVRHLERCLDLQKVSWSRVESSHDHDGPVVTLSTETAAGTALADAYRLSISADQIDISATTGSGLFYGVSTLAQWLRLHRPGENRPPATVAGLRAKDWPSFPQRGIMLDVSRNKVPTMKTLRELVDKLSMWKINQLQLYVEHTFAYSGHEKVWQGASPLTAEEVRELDRYCRERYIDLVPNQQSLGHMHRWLAREPYRALAERPDGVDHPFSPAREPFSLCPTDPRSIELIGELYAELLPNFSSTLFNVGLDETFDLGTGRSAAACESRGRHNVYLEFLREVSRLARDHGRRIQFWADIVLRHPQSIGKLPHDAIALNWGHEADHPFLEQTAALARSGLEFYVCPGTSSWSSFAGRADNALRNLGNAALAGVANGATGLLVTDWGDHGHLQPLSSSWLGLLAGAALAWNADTETHPTKPVWQKRLDWHAFKHPEAEMGRIAMALGNAYLATGTPSRNGTPLFHLLMSPLDTLDHGRYEGLTIKRLEVVLAAVGHAGNDLDLLAQQLPESASVRELQWTARALALAARVGIERSLAGPSTLISELAAEARGEIRDQLARLLGDLRGIWLERNRRGGLEDSLARFLPLLQALGV